MTLGRALLDTGDWAAARTEFEMVLKSAADNILASRYLGECLENLGERDAAIARYKSTLAMAPGEKHVVARLAVMEKGVGTSPPPAAAPALQPRPPTGLRPASTEPATGAFQRPTFPSPQPAAPAPSVAPPPPAAVVPPVPPPAAEPVAPPAAELPAPPPPIPLATVEGEMELESSSAAMAASAPPAPGPGTNAFAPIPVVDADDDFELERAYESRTTSVGITAAAAAASPAAPGGASPPAEDQEFELEAPHEAPSVGWAATIRPLPVVEEPPAPRVATALPPPSAPAPTPVSAPVPPAPAPFAAAPATPSTLTSPTLGELYFNQGFTDKAIEVYRDLTAREPENERLSARLQELEKIQRSLSGPEAAPSAPPAPAAIAELPPAPVTLPPTAVIPALPPAAPPAVAETASVAKEDPGPAPPPEPEAAALSTTVLSDAALSTAEQGAAERREAIERTISRLEGLLAAIRKG